MKTPTIIFTYYCVLQVLVAFCWYDIGFSKGLTQGFNQEQKIAKQKELDIVSAVYANITSALVECSKATATPRPAYTKNGWISLESINEFSIINKKSAISITCPIKAEYFPDGFLKINSN